MTFTNFFKQFNEAMVKSGIPVIFNLHCITVAKTIMRTSHMDIDSYLNYFNDHEADQNVIYSADMAIIVKKNIGKLYWYWQSSTYTVF